MRWATNTHYFVNLDNLTSKELLELFHLIDRLDKHWDMKTWKLHGDTLAVGQWLLNDSLDEKIAFVKFIGDIEERLERSAFSTADDSATEKAHLPYYTESDR